MVKRFLLIFSSILLSFSLAACGANEDQDQNPPPEDQENGPMEDTGRQLDEVEEDLEAPIEDPDNDGVDENDPNPED
ncbi:hypothetical protein [Cytobacillus kochii]